MLQGMTVRYLFRETFKVGPGTVMLFHAAAGGVGLIACQWAQGAGRDHDRHRGLSGEGRARQGPRLHSRHQLSQRGLRGAREGDHRRRAVRRGLRFDRQGYVSGVARLPEAEGTLGELWQRVGRRAAVRSFGSQGIALCNAAFTHGLHGQARRSSQPTQPSSSIWWPRVKSTSRSTSAMRLKDAARGPPRSRSALTTGSTVLLT